jgi:spore germination cell wall hydrolase CwlJ-like protein
MSKTGRAGAIATAMMICATLFGAQASGALAETAPEAASEAAPAPLPAAAIEPAAEDAPRFYAEEVVQPVPEADASDAASLAELVEAMPADGSLSRDLQCLAQAIYFEARGEPLDGQLAVGAVIVNRTASGRYPSDYCSVVTQRGQFSFVRGGRIPAPDESSPAWTRARAIAQIAHQDLWQSPAGEALFFHARYVRPGWARSKVQLATIDSHIFYR